jgi:hypothetical protein
MKKTLILCGLLLAVSAPSAMAAGVNLNWTDCMGAGPVTNVVFACNANTGASTLIGSYNPPAHIDSVCGADVVVDLVSTSPTLPLWWNIQTGGCRAGALSRSFDFTSGPFTCIDHWSGNVALASGGYTITGPNTARVLMSGAVASVNCDGPADTGVDPGNEYYAFKMTLSRAKTVGTGACAGCSDGVSLVLNEIKLYSPSRGTQDVTYSLVSPDLQNCVSWNNGAPNGCQATPTRNRTWGAVKTLYR